jgi:polyphenol oxidase
VADCLPVLLAAEGGVAALHCGWRPLAGGIVEEGLRALREVGADGPVQAAIGPGARGCCYEVGEEVHAHFAAYDARRGRNLDLAAVARAQLEANGVEVHDTGLCTICDERFFSHRRDRGVTGRQAGVAWRS